MAPEDTDSTPRRATNNTSQPEVQLSAICPDNLSLVPQQSVVPGWFTAEQTNARMAASQQTQCQVPKTNSDSKVFGTHSSAHVDRSFALRPKRHQDQAVSPKLNSFPTGREKPYTTGKSPDLQSLEYFLNTPPEQNIWANEDPPSIKQTSQSTNDERQISSSTDKKHQKPKLKKEAGASAVPSGLSSRPDVAFLERQIKYLDTRASEVAHQLSRGTSKQQQRELHRQLFSLEKTLQEKNQALRDYKMRHPTAPVSKEDRADQRPIRDQLEEVWSGGPSELPREYPVTTSPREPEDEWMEIELEDLEQPLGQEEWEDDIVPELIPSGAAKSPFYPGAMI